MRPYLGLLYLVLFALGCAPNQSIQLVAEGEVLKVSAAISPIPKRVGEETKVTGHVIVTNKTDDSQPYGNEFLLLSANHDHESRAWVQTVATMLVDVALVDIKPHDSLAMNMFWVLNEAPGTEPVALALRLDEGGIKRMAEGRITTRSGGR